MKQIFHKRLTALCLSLLILLSCAAPYGFAAETDGTGAEAVAEISADAAEAATEAVADAPDVEAEVDVADAVAVSGEAAVEEEPDATDAVAPDTEAVADAPDVATGDAVAVSDTAAVEEEPDAAEAEDAVATLSDVVTGLTDFSSFNHPDLVSIDTAAHTVTLSHTGGDHFVVYNGLDHVVNSFVWEADVDFQQGVEIKSAALLFGFKSKVAPNGYWYGANLDSTRLNNPDAFRVFGPNIDIGGRADGVDINRTLHLKIDVHSNGAFTYYYGNAGAEARTVTGTIGSWRGGYIGLLTWESGATFSNIAFEERDEPIVVPDFGTVTTTGGFQYNNNIANATLSDLRTQGGTWEARANGLYSNAVDRGDAFLYSQTTGGNFVYSTDVTFLREQGAATLIFRNADPNGHDECYAANIDGGSKRCKLWRWQEGMDNQLFGEVQFNGSAANNVYTLTVVAIDTWLSFYVNGELIGSTGDYYKLGGADWGQDTYISSGTFGLLNWNGEMIFQNTTYTPIEGTFNPLLSDITVTSSGTVEQKGQFVSTEPITIQYVKNNADTVNIAATPVGENTNIRVCGPDGTEYPNGRNIPVAVGANYIAVQSSVTNADGTTATVTYRVNVHRRQADALYYNEPYRGQYHYSVKDGWANDPNGMVYFNGTYHFFYQFYDDIEWGPMHWMHVTSPDLIHWTEQPMAFYPDANGSMFSGCIVADVNNTSGLFSGSGGGLVALITANGNGQRIKVAYSTDEGRTWTKVNNIAADWSHDPLYSRDFRDPKVFRWENKWFMVLAGGPLRIYSSDNLLEWQCESTYANLHTECPDLYPLRADDGVIKWVLSRGGRTYKVGDLRQVGGKWTFVPDAPYANEPDNGIMNFGRDSYAAMTYYVQDFGTAANPTLPDIIEINWMNTWDDYCRDVARKVGQKFNGTFNLNLRLGLKNDGGKYVLTQTPIQAYETLRGTPTVSLTGAAVTANNTLLSGFSGDCYEIVSKFYPGTATSVGFDLRVGNGEKTSVRYNVAEERLSIDRSQSGILISNLFGQVNSQAVARNADGSVDLRVFVDRSSVEVFTKDYTVAGANQIFPGISSRGAAVVAEGGDATADITIYPMSGTWTERIDSTTPIELVSNSRDNTRVNVGDTLNFRATLVPVSAPQNINWTVSDNSVLSVNGSATGNDFSAIVLRPGDVTVTAASAVNPALMKTFSVHSSINNFDTNIPSFTVNGGEWTIDDQTLSVENHSANQFYMSSAAVGLREFTLETNIRFTRGAINIFFAAAGVDPFNPQAYAVQFNDSTSFRLFRFGGDDITPPTDMGQRVNDGQFHNVKIRKTANSVTVSVDNVEKLNYTFDSVENFFNDGAFVGIGLWDGALDVQTFRVTENASNPTPGGNGGNTPSNPDGNGGNTSGRKSGCYVATSVYGSYDCPQVWTLRRFRDNVLAETWYGRLFIKLYYAVSPTAVRLFGDADWFQSFFRDRLDDMVADLQADGFEATPYDDIAW